MTEGLSFKPKDNEEIRARYDKDTQEILDGHYEDLGEGNLRFLPVNALEALKDWADDELEKYEENYGG